jgi:fatty-acyl-CoA synthase
MSNVESPNRPTASTSAIPSGARTPHPALLLDRFIRDTLPKFTSASEVENFEKTPYSTRISAPSTFDAIKLGALHNPDGPALQFLPNASHEDTPVIITHRQFVARVTQTANALHELGVGPRDVVSFMLPLIPHSFFTLFGAEAAGICNPLNPLLEPHQIVEILRATGTKVLVALGPTPGTDIWEKVLKVRGELRGLKPSFRWVGESTTRTVSIRSMQSLAANPQTDWLAGERYRQPTSRPISTPAAQRARRNLSGIRTPIKSIRHGAAICCWEARRASICCSGCPFSTSGAR